MERIGALVVHIDDRLLRFNMWKMEPEGKADPGITVDVVDYPNDAPITLRITVDDYSFEAAVDRSNGLFGWSSSFKVVGYTYNDTFHLRVVNDVVNDLPGLALVH